MKIILVIAILFFFPFSVSAQNLINNRDGRPDLFKDMPDIRNSNTPDDEEDVYFILSGEADRAIAENDYETAKLRIMEALSVDRYNPSNVLLLSNLGLICSYLDEDSLALEALDEALRRAPSMTTALLNRAHVHLKLGNDAKALQDFETTISIDSVNCEARYYRGIMSLYNGNLETATNDFNVLKSVYPDSYNTAAAFATLYSMTGQDLLAVPYYRKLIQEDPSPEYYAALAGCYLALGRLSEASETLSEGMAVYTRDPELYFYRAWLNRDSYRLNDARNDAAKAKEYGADPRKVDALFRSR